MPPRKLFAVVASLGALAAPAVAHAGPLVASASDCASQSLSQTFLRWGDVASYTLDPGGDFEQGSNWALTGDAGVVPGNEPFRVGSASDGNSLSVPAGSSATSPSLCVGIEHPDMRFFAAGSSPTARLAVEVLFEDSSGHIQSAPIGAISGGAWAPTAPLPLVVNLLPLMPGGRTAVAFRFSATGGSFRIDDVYVDPYRSV
jgi:hypothetical protein